MDCPKCSKEMMEEPMFITGDELFYATGDPTLIDEELSQQSEYDCLECGYHIYID